MQESVVLELIAKTEDQDLPRFGGYFEEVAEADGLTILRRTDVPFPFKIRGSLFPESRHFKESEDNTSTLSPAVLALLLNYYPELFIDQGLIEDTL